MVSQDESPDGREKQVEKPEESKRHVERAIRHNLRLPLRYRLDGEEVWCPGETINISRSGILFYSSEAVEVDAQVEIIFETSGGGLLHSNTQRALIVRRMLSNWPETRPILGARFGV